MYEKPLNYEHKGFNNTLEMVAERGLSIDDTLLRARQRGNFMMLRYLANR